MFDTPPVRNEFNTRLLVIDDEESVRDSFREILTPRHEHLQDLNELSELGAGLFDEAPTTHRAANSLFRFSLDEASSGRAGLDLVKEAVAAQSPYAAIFVDMRMPGWDGLETVEQIRALDKRAEIVFVTAYSDHSIEDIVDRAGANVSYHCKPFSFDEVRQIATKCVYEWNRTRNLEELIHIISDLGARQWEMKSLLNNVLHQVADLMGCRSALLAACKGSGQYDVVTAIGQFRDGSTAADYLSSLPETIDGEMFRSDRLVFFRLKDYGIVALFETEHNVFNAERVYLIRLFIEEASLTIKNLELRESLLQKEKLSAVGQAVSMISHDLVNHIGSIPTMVELAKESLYAGQEKLERKLDLIGSSAECAMELTRDILDFARQKAISPDCIVLDEFLEELERDCRTALRDLAVPLSIANHAPPALEADRSKLRRILINLVKNAGEALRDNGVETPEVRLVVRQTDGDIVFSVADNGPGIPEVIRDNLFQPFVTEGKSGGTGLGLAIVKQFVKAHGGKITLDSSPSGTTFTFNIPQPLS